MARAENSESLHEEIRLQEDARREKNWKRWGPYLSERQWGTVREDYSADGSAWQYFPHEHARSRAYRWGEDGLLGITDRQGRLAFALALWNGRDPILKERLFGLTGKEGNHGEDVKELYYYLDSSPTHSYMKALYKYPQAEFPYRLLLEENRRRGKNDPEFELTDTGIFAQDRYFDVTVEYAKAGPDDILIRITAANRGPQAAELHLLPTIWFRNTWSWERSGEAYWPEPRIEMTAPDCLEARHESLGAFHLKTAAGPDVRLPLWLFTNNETNVNRLFDDRNPSKYVKDAFHRLIVEQDTEAVNPEGIGTKAAALFDLTIQAGQKATLTLRLYPAAHSPKEAGGPGFNAVFQKRIAETDAFYRVRLPGGLDDQRGSVARQAYAGLLWNKQFYHYSIIEWLEGDPSQPAPPESRRRVRNYDWPHLYNRDVISMPDKWEYPWYAAWDLAFHMIPFSRIDPGFAKKQLVLFLREWYMHPNGQIPAYEFALSDVNPPVHAWSAWRVYKMTSARGERDHLFLARVFQKLLLNFTWWVNRKDLHDNHIFSGGFLGLDNIGVFDRSRPLPTGGHLEQADGTAWMAFYCSTMLSMALELARTDPAYEDTASKFFEHFIAINDAINHLGGTGLWDETDGFYYDHLNVDDSSIPLRIRSLVGLLPLIAVEVIEKEVIDNLPGFSKRMNWFLDHRKDLPQFSTCMEEQASRIGHRHRLLAIPSRQRLEKALRYMLDEKEFLSPYGIRSLSKFHKDHPYVFEVDGNRYQVSYQPGESDTAAFGGNSNWRGPIWFPINYLIVEALERYHYFYGDSFKIECPTGSGNRLTLGEVASEILKRLVSIFLVDASGSRPCHGGLADCGNERQAGGPVLFHEYFHADTGRGLGASHQTGWTALIAQCMEKLAKNYQGGGLCKTSSPNWVDSGRC